MTPLGVVGGEAMLGAFRFQTCCAKSPPVYSSPQSEALDARTMQGLRPSRECFVGFEGFVLAA